MASTDIRTKTEVWFVGRREEKPDGSPDYHIQGIATSEVIALEMCRDANYFIGPFPVNVVLPHERCEWPGMYFPLKENVSPT